jgi:hypothetical protein
MPCLIITVSSPTRQHDPYPRKDKQSNSDQFCPFYWSVAALSLLLRRCIRPICMASMRWMRMFLCPQRMVMDPLSWPSTAFPSLIGIGSLERRHEEWFATEGLWREAYGTAWPVGTLKKWQMWRPLGDINFSLCWLGMQERSDEPLGSKHSEPQLDQWNCWTQISNCFIQLEVSYMYAALDGECVVHIRNTKVSFRNHHINSWWQCLCKNYKRGTDDSSVRLTSKLTWKFCPWLQLNRTRLRLLRSQPTVTQAKGAKKWSCQTRMSGDECWKPLDRVCTLCLVEIFR